MNQRLALAVLVGAIVVLALWLALPGVLDSPQPGEQPIPRAESRAELFLKPHPGTIHLRSGPLEFGHPQHGTLDPRVGIHGSAEVVAPARGRFVGHLVAAPAPLSDWGPQSFTDRPRATPLPAEARALATVSVGVEGGESVRFLFEADAVQVRDVVEQIMRGLPPEASTSFTPPDIESIESLRVGRALLRLEHAGPGGETDVAEIIVPADWSPTRFRSIRQAGGMSHYSAGGPEHPFFFVLDSSTDVFLATREWQGGAVGGPVLSWYWILSFERAVGA